MKRIAMLALGLCLGSGSPGFAQETPGLFGQGGGAGTGSLGNGGHLGTGAARFAAEFAELRRQKDILSRELRGSSFEAALRAVMAAHPDRFPLPVDRVGTIQLSGIDYQDLPIGPYSAALDARFSYSVRYLDESLATGRLRVHYRDSWTPSGSRIELESVDFR